MSVRTRLLRIRWSVTALISSRSRGDPVTLEGELVALAGQPVPLERETVLLDADRIALARQLRLGLGGLVLGDCDS